MRVGILSCYDVRNYGSVLQSFALERIVEGLGHEAITIRHSDPHAYRTQSKLSYYMHKLSNPATVARKGRVRFSAIKLKKYKNIGKQINCRNEKFEEFSEHNLNLSRLCGTRQKLEEYCANFDCIMVGSDQLWNPATTEHDFYTLSFVPDGVRKVSYSTSFGTTRIPKRLKRKYNLFLNNFDAISVREESGLKLLDDLKVKVPGKFVLDPVLLMNSADWMKCAEAAKYRPPEEKYILCYFLGINPQHRKVVEMIKEHTGYKIVALQHLDEFVEKDVGFGDYTPFEIGPFEFVKLVSGASLVCTDSFHGTCFSVIFQKKILVFNRFNDSNLESTNTRIDSILNVLGLQDRRVVDYDDLNSILKKTDTGVDYNNVYRILDDYRGQSINYLKDSLA